MILKPATKPTFYFIGVTTGQSSIMTVFPKWADHLGLGDVHMQGIDMPPHDTSQNYRDVVNFIKTDPLSCGALVTTHKLDLFAAARDLFDEIDPHAALMAETSCLSKRDGKLICHAKDPVSSGLSIDGFLPPNHFATTGAEVFSMGAGGSTIALTWHLMQQSRGQNRPSRIVVSNRSQSRLDHIRQIHEQLDTDIPCDYVLAPTPEDNDAVLGLLKPRSLVINATGLGKDAPGSPLTFDAQFPKNAVVWELNYRGDLVFLDQANAQHDTKSLQIEDGWTYFIHGWTQVIAEVFDVDIPISGPKFEALSRIAADVTGRTT
ncbi:MULTISPECIES: shikimate dehydrogenase family protein [Pacificibacter]|uniref:shikimate dehydrogenase family protein n=1 Tax=Pacificibacter TaxID=1042323 RepID=UPI001C09A005|nr:MULTISPECIES: shikimate dehydrogenase [Pacificibacter]MBU2937157.1 shikimate dehydrogenase [Pacificibacter marinus]MDO6617023.1 shikimate dehydrogenase [Pacificibacter sp. 1_MG-2023]